MEVLQHKEHASGSNLTQCATFGSRKVSISSRCMSTHAAAFRPREKLSLNARIGQNLVSTLATSIMQNKFDEAFRVSSGAAPSQLDLAPATYGKGGQGVMISFGIASCSLGLVLVATTPRGVCAVALGDSEQELEAALRREFFAADVQRDQSELQDSLEHVLQVLEGREPHGRLSLDVRATAWQWKVWRALCEIKAGQRCSYAQVAQNMGAPNAVRAVARACATNPIALVVPCHRVVRGDGSLAGYRWGLERKKILLAREKAAIENL